MLLVFAITAIFMLFLLQNHHLKLPLVASKDYGLLVSRNNLEDTDLGNDLGGIIDTALLEDFGETLEVTRRKFQW